MNLLIIKLFLGSFLYIQQFVKVCGQQEWSRFRRQLPPDNWNWWRSPIERFDKFTFSKKMNAYGEYVKGFSVPMYLEDTFWDINWGEYPQWLLRRVNCFLGVPYAEPPIGRYRFQKPVPPRWVGTWDATYFRPSCPQKLEILQQQIPTYEAYNISEDCLYLNIFVPNRTQPNLEFDKRIYPVLVYVHTGNFSTGSAQLHPGQVLATRDVVVVTLNYRLGALGFLTTEDEHAPGNFGLWDQVLALEFIKRNIVSFRGDPNRITLMGEGAGAVSVGLHLVSPASRNKGFYKQVILMSGTDLSMFGVGNPFYQPRQYARQLARIVGCPSGDDSYEMVRCLRNNNSISWQQIVSAQQQIKPIDGVFGATFVPVQDGLFYSIPSEGFLPEHPDDYRREKQFARVPAIIGINANDGAQLANDTVMGLRDGVSEAEVGRLLDDLMVRWKIVDVYRDRARDAIAFQYTHWPDPSNITALGQEFINMVTDIEFGVGMDRVVKAMAEFSNVYMYIFNWKSYNDWLPWYLGVSHSVTGQYVFGFPFMNETILNETELVPLQYFDYDDRNISDFMIYMWTSFVTYGDPTPNVTRNITWEPFNEQNLTYLEVRWYNRLWFRYRQSQYGFWADYFPRMALQDYYYATATPTPGAYEYVVSTGALATLLALLLAAIFIVAYLTYYHHKQQRDMKYRHEKVGLQERTELSPQPGSSHAGSSQAGSELTFISGSSRPDTSFQSQMTSAQYSDYCKRSTAPVHHSVI